jgi:hypothetical protein
MKAEQLIVYQVDPTDDTRFTPSAKLDMLPRMRVSDIVFLIRGIASDGDYCRYERQLFRLSRGYLHAVPASEEKKMSFAEVSES